MMRFWVMFCPVVGVVQLAGLPVDAKLLLTFLIARAFSNTYLCTIIKNHRMFMLRVLPFVVVVDLFVAF
jgi:hypothetical protein